MSAQPVDVLRKLAFWAADTTQPEHETKERVAARAAVVELVEADKEYDEARAAFERVHPRANPAYVHAMRNNLDLATRRRVAALARVQGGAG